MNFSYFITAFLILAFLFFVGSLGGWILELFYRRFFSAANPERKWINPGFLSGPYLPLYGFGLCSLYILAHINTDFIGNKLLSKLILFVLMSIIVTIIEFIAGEIFIIHMKIKLWDYDNEWGNIKGVICPKYSFFWIVLSAIYYFLIHPHILNSLLWLSNHLAFSFVVGFFYGVFAMDLGYSFNVMTKIRKYARENEIIVRYELLKESIRIKNHELMEKGHFLFAFKTNGFSFSEALVHYNNNIKDLMGKINNKKK